MKRVLFVCLGNICRSPLGEGIFRHLVHQQGLQDRYEIDSAGTAGYHIGDPPDPRSTDVAARHGVSLAGQQGRKVAFEDYLEFDWILAMDAKNLADLMDEAPPKARSKIVLLRSFDPEGGNDVPDPYYGGPSGFDEVFQMVERSCVALLAKLESESP